MKKYVNILAAAVLLSVLALHQASGIRRIKKQKYLDKILKKPKDLETHKFVVVKFYEKGCNTCKEALKALSAVKKERGTRYVRFVKVPVGTPAKPSEIAKEYAANMQYVLIFKNGKRVGTIQHAKEIKDFDKKGLMDRVSGYLPEKVKKVKKEKSKKKKEKKPKKKAKKKKCKKSTKKKK